jgi:hypothetical protein
MRLAEWCVLNISARCLVPVIRNLLDSRERVLLELRQPLADDPTLRLRIRRTALL